MLQMRSLIAASSAAVRLLPNLQIPCKLKSSESLKNSLRSYSTESEPSQKENEFAYSLLEKIVSYQTKIIRPLEPAVSTQNLDSVLEKCDPDSASLSELLELIHQVSLFERSVKILAGEHDVFLRACRSISDQISAMSESELKHVVSSFSRLNCTGAPLEFKKLISKMAITIKDELITRDDVTTDSLLYFMDFFNHVNRQALSSSFLSLFKTRVDSMDKEQSILLLHNLSVSYMSHQRKDLLSKLEERVIEFFDKCSTQELAVASLGFFRSRYVLTSEELVEKLSSRLVSDLDNLSEMTIISLVKIINYSTRNQTAYTNVNVRQNMRSTTQALLTKLKDFSPSSCTNLFRISSSLHQLNHNLMDALCQKVINSDIDEWRLKDLAWFTFTFGQFQCMMEESHWFYEKIIKSLEKLERRPEITRHPNALVQALVGLSLVGIYPNNLLNEVLSPLFRNKMKGRIPLDLSRDLLFLDQGLRLERPQYDGFLLPDDFFDKLPKGHPIFKERLLPHDKRQHSKRDEMLLQIQSSLDLLCGRDMCAEIAFVFRHHNTADIILKTDGERKPVPIFDWTTTNLSVVDKSGQKTIVILVAAPNTYTVYDTEYGYARKLLATHITKRRQAELLGHHVVEIPYFKWYDKSANRREYLMERLADFVSFDR